MRTRRKGACPRGNMAERIDEGGARQRRRAPADGTSAPSAGAAGPPWVLIAGGFHARGGMDRANAALAAHLLECGREVHLVAHAVDPHFAENPRARLHLVPRPASSDLLGELLLERRGREVARAVTAARRGARVVVNGGNCAWADVNWLHCVHHAWPPADAGAPLWFKVKNRLGGWCAQRREQRAVRAARLVIANSERTRRDATVLLGVEGERARTLYLGSDEACEPVTAGARRAARAALGLGADGARPLVAFVGALGHDQNKGLDTLWRAWAALREAGGWDARLVVAGGGRGLPHWRARAQREELGESIRLLGFTERVGELLTAADLLVSPARYEAYGLNVHEAICRGVPALVSRAAGVAERYPPELSEMILADPADAVELAARLLAWRSEIDAWPARFAPLAEELRRRTWSDMAAEFVALVEGAGAACAGERFARTA